MMKVSGYVVEASNGRLYGIFETADAAVAWMNDVGRNIAGSLNIRVIYSAEDLSKAA